MQYTHKQSFNTNEKQHNTLNLLRNKYNHNVSKFIRDAINEKLNREKNDIYKNYNEIQLYLKKLENCPF